MKNPKEYYSKAEELVGRRKDLIPSRITGEDLEHISNIAASVMMTRDGILPGGSFVRAICDNDLHGAVHRADSVNVHMIPFYVWVYHNGTI